ncbi:MAG: hypothetical protein JXQ68_01095 [Campylobacterales bacterium]|nr:hypothetical protein [Campylobacterales bacterium]
MNLENLLEENSIESISKKTNISVDNLKRLVEHDFSDLKKVQALGFLSILERDYKVDVEALKQECREFFGDHKEEELSIPLYQVKEKSKSKWWFFVFLFLSLSAILLIIAYDYVKLNGKNGSQMFLTQEMVLGEANASKNIPEDMVASGTISQNELKETKDEDLVFADNTAQDIADDVNSSTTVELHAAIIPKYKLWFGIYDLKSGKSSHRIIKDAFKFNAAHDLLIATSTAGFSTDVNGEITNYEDFKEHYFMLKGGKFSEIKREEFLELNGPKKW